MTKPSGKNVIIAGAGRVGSYLARLLTREDFNVIITDIDLREVEQIDDEMDLQSMECDAVDLPFHDGIDMGNTQLFVACTGNDELNMLTAATAKSLGAREVVARVERLSYLDRNIIYESMLSVDYLLSPKSLTAHAIAGAVGSPGQFKNESIARGLLQVIELRTTKSPLRFGQTLKDLQLPEDVLVGGIARGDSVFIADGTATIQPGDIISLVGRRKQLEGARELFRSNERAVESVVIMGGGKIGSHLAGILERQNLVVKVLEYNEAVCHELSQQLRKAKIVCRDATSRKNLEMEHVNTADVFIATSHDDERNIMAGILAREVGVQQVMSVIHNPDFARLVQRLGIDMTFTPRDSFADRVVRLLHQKEGTSSTYLHDGAVELFEITVQEETRFTGKSLEEVSFPKDSRIAGIIRDGELLVPTGDTHIHRGDTLVAMVRPENVLSFEKALHQ